MTDLGKLWSDAVDELAETIGDARQVGYLRLTRARALVEDTVLFSAPDAFTRDVIEARLRPAITDVLSRRLGRPVSIAVTVNPEPGPLPSPALAPPPEAEPMVTRGVRLPATLDKRMRDAADRAGVPFSQLIREWIELGLAEMDDEQMVSLATLRRAIAHAALVS